MHIALLFFGNMVEELGMDPLAEDEEGGFGTVEH
jgi:hypothetical protein